MNARYCTPPTSMPAVGIVVCSVPGTFSDGMISPAWPGASSTAESNSMPSVRSVSVLCSSTLLRQSPPPPPGPPHSPNVSPNAVSTPPAPSSHMMPRSVAVMSHFDAVLVAPSMPVISAMTMPGEWLSLAQAGAIARPCAPSSTTPAAATANVALVRMISPSSGARLATRASTSALSKIDFIHNYQSPRRSGNSAPKETR